MSTNRLCYICDTVLTTTASAMCPHCQQVDDAWQAQHDAAVAAGTVATCTGCDCVYQTEAGCDGRCGECCAYDDMESSIPCQHCGTSNVGGHCDLCQVTTTQADAEWEAQQDEGPEPEVNSCAGCLRGYYGHALLCDACMTGTLPVK